MNSLSSSQLRQIRTDFWLSKQHVQLPEVSLIADKDSTALFNVAGMQPLIPYLLGKDHPLGKRLFNIQKCIRTVDIAEVGDASHLTFFEMMGNWSLGDYFKKEAVHWSWEFLTQSLQIDPRKLAVTVFEGDEGAPRDEESATYRKEIGIPTERISYLPADNNRWSPGPVGPCGPDTEIYYWVGDSEFPPAESTVENDEDHRLEIWNNVFMEYYRDENGTLTKLSKQNVDTGMGFERMCCVLQKKDSVYDTDLFVPTIQVIENYLQLAPAALRDSPVSPSHQRRLRIVADHARTAFMLVNDGLVPSNVGAGYVLRMIIRRMVYNVMLLHEFPLEKYPDFLRDVLASFQGLRDFKQEEIIRVLMDEVKLFQKTLQNGMQILEGLISRSSSQGQMLGSDVFKLYDTYGFPVELTREIVAEKGLSIDEKGFETALESAKEKSRQATKEMFKKGIDWSKYLEGIPQTEFIGYTAFSSDAPQLLKEIDLEGQKILIFDKTPFYPEMGGQMGDIGEITLETGEIKKVSNVQKFAGVILHFISE